MIIVEYILTPTYGEWKSVAGRGNEVEIRVGEGVGGMLYFGTRRAEVINGQARFSTRGLSDGQNTPYLSTDVGETELEPLVLFRERLTPAPTTDRVHRISLSRLRALEKTEKENKERIDELYTLIKGNALFN